MPGKIIMGDGVPPELLKLLGLGEGDEDEESAALSQLERKEQKRRERYSDADARLMLKNAYAVLKQTYEFKEGDILRYKQGVESGRKEPCGGLAIFIKYEADPCPPDVGSRSDLLATTFVDCVIGVLLPTGALAEYRVNSRYLEPAPEQE